MGWPPRESIERIDRILHIGPVSLVAYHQQWVALSPLIQFLPRERETGYGTTDWVGSPFSQDQWLCPSLLTTLRNVTICRPHAIHMINGHTQTKHGMCVACWLDCPLHSVHWFESLWLSDMTNPYLWQSSRRDLNELNEKMFSNDLWLYFTLLLVFLLFFVLVQKYLV
jgi:hypothetical protein